MDKAIALTKTVEWQTPEYEHFDKDIGWFKAVFLVTVISVILALVFQNFFFALILLLSGFVIMLYGARLPEMMEVILTPKGVRINQNLFPYDRLKSFWLSDSHGEGRAKKLILEADRFFLPHVVIPLAAETDEELVREYLLQYLPELRHEESFADVIADLIHF
jgi:hypothetical protein